MEFKVNSLKKKLKRITNQEVGKDCRKCFLLHDRLKFTREKS